MSNLFEQPSPSGTPQNDTERPRPFASIAEAVAYSKLSLEIDRPPKYSEDLPWKKSAEILGPRNALQLHLDYLGDSRWRESLKQDTVFMGALQEVQCHNGYDVKPDAPEEIQRLAKSLRGLGQQLPFHIAFMELQTEEIENNTHPLCIKLRQAEESHDTAQVRILQTEIRILSEILQTDLKRYKKALDFVQNRQVWERTLAPKAARLKRLRQLIEIIESPRPEGELTKPESDAYLIAKAEAAREVEALRKSGLATGNGDLQLYLYQNPDIAPSMEFAPLG